MERRMTHGEQMTILTVLLIGLLLLLASRGEGAVRWTLAASSLAPAIGFHYITKIARRNGA